MGRQLKIKLNRPTVEKQTIQHSITVIILEQLRTVISKINQTLQLTAF